MKPQYFIAILFGASLYWMYLLYAPYLMSITIAALLAISTSNIQKHLENIFRSRLAASFVSSFLLAVIFFVPLGYFLTTLTLQLNSIETSTINNLQNYIKSLLENPPSYLQFLQPYFSENLDQLDIKAILTEAIKFAGKIGTFSAGFIKNSLFVIVFYFFAQYYGTVIATFVKRVVQVSSEDGLLLSHELTSVMSVVFYSIIATAMLEGALFGVVVGYLGYDGILFGIMYGFASLIPVIGGLILWLPFMLYEFSIGNDGNAWFIAIYSVVMISIIADTFIKPVIILWINEKLLNENDAKLNELIIFFAILAGLTTFGFWGMILGPAITAFFLTILKLFEARTRECESKEDR